MGKFFSSFSLHSGGEDSSNAQSTVNDKRINSMEVDCGPLYTDLAHDMIYERKKKREQKRQRRTKRKARTMKTNRASNDSNNFRVVVGNNEPYARGGCEIYHRSQEPSEKHHLVASGQSLATSQVWPAQSHQGTSLPSSNSKSHNLAPMFNDMGSKTRYSAVHVIAEAKRAIATKEETQRFQTTFTFVKPKMTESNPFATMDRSAFR